MAGETFVYGPFNVNDDSAIVTALSGLVVVADHLTSWSSGNSVWFGVVKA